MVRIIVKYNFLFLLTLVMLVAVSCKKGGEPTPKYNLTQSTSEDVASPNFKKGDTEIDDSDENSDDDSGNDSSGGGTIVGGDDNEDDDGGTVIGGDDNEDDDGATRGGGLGGGGPVPLPDGGLVIKD